MKSRVNNDMYNAQFILISVLFFCAVAFSQNHSITSISNDLLTVQLDDCGFFNLGTIRGQSLISAFPEQPKTSHFNLYIDDDIIHNWQNNKLHALESCGLQDGKLLAIWRDGPLYITQTLSLEQYSTKTAFCFIQYEIMNMDSVAHSVGLLLELDTMVGSNDAAPLASSVGYLANETEFVAPNMPDFYQAYERGPSEPGLIAKGLLSTGNATTPDFLACGDWQKFRDVLWNVSIENAKYGDSAVILRWNPKILASGSTRYFATYYGIGNDAVTRDQLSLNASSIEKLAFSTRMTNAPFDVNLQITNSGTKTASDVTARISVPQGFHLVNKEKAEKQVSPGLSREFSKIISWKVAPDSLVETGIYKFNFDVSSSNMPSSRVALTLPVERIKTEFTYPSLLAEPTPPENLPEEQVETIQRDVAIGHIDFGEYDVNQFPLGYYKPFTYENMSYFELWVKKNPSLQSEYDRLSNDKKTPATIRYVFQSAAKKISEYIFDLAKQSQQQHKRLVIEITGFTDPQQVSALTNVDEDILVEGHQISTLYTSNKELANLRAYHTWKDLKTLIDQMDPGNYFDRLIKEGRLSMQVTYWKPDGICPNRTAPYHMQRKTIIKYYIKDEG